MNSTARSTQPMHAQSLISGTYAAPPTIRKVPLVEPSVQGPDTRREGPSCARARRSYVREVAPRATPSPTEPESLRTRISSVQPRSKESTQSASAHLIDDRYRVEQVVGEGGMARVFSATHAHLGHRVCIKQMLPTLAADKECVARFLREARTSASLSSRHALHVFDVGVSRAGVPYIVMEHLSGQNLHEMLEAAGPATAAQVVAVMLQVCEAVGEAHQRGVVHRDLKPSNLFLVQLPGAAPLVKVLDFGVASVSDAKGLTSTHAFLGSPHYMAPEQARSAAAASPRSDVWSLGATMYTMLTGRRPFDGGTVGGVLAAAQQGRYTPVEHLRDDVPVFLQAIVHRCLALDPLARPANATELGALLRLGAPTASAATEAIRPTMSAPRAAAPLSAPRAPRMLPSGRVGAAIGFALSLLLGIAGASSIALAAHVVTAAAVDGGAPTAARTLP